ncbi:heat-inducible transcription repressor HrcA [Clostridium homopropionicum DSM 5847]|uniref:Heat-inducible transcription repressor HrcA n=1 Tax=Clostridium homopropionicum DSM 5847 TaxID=1121318 RepID=A0A0L6ZE53_9CLOT|nr:heat-inducible transcriptional repressor HrcA [Clostridium homopropionicum]KOA21246.1 heat-inducible transcription repressor HrcA [Clostridium homopropionicum DSM 5847]SFG28519.1 heat-inducible transcription repressor HrcA [Clostridium homopropionicum]
MDNFFGIDDRKIKILQAIINDYISTGEPVGSRTISKKYDLGISSATIRNEMSDLEEMGLIEQLHTSSGRKPSDSGYRLYVDKLIKLPKLTKQEELMIKNELIGEALYEVDKILKKSIHLLSELTKLTCVVNTPSVRNSSIKLIQLLFIDSNNIVAVIVTQNGIVDNKIIRLNKPINNQVLQRISLLLNNRLSNLTIEEINLKVINELKRDLTGYEDIFDAIITVLYESLTKADNSEIYYEGASNIFNYPEYNDIDRAREFLSLIDNKDVLKQLIFNSLENINDGMSFTIKIGKENSIENAQNCSIISAVYSIGSKPMGTIGVIGPTRMHYSKVISLLTNMVMTINKSVDKKYSDDR